MKGINMNKKLLINELCNCAKIYHKNLENRNIMFIYIDEEIKYIETKFTKSNFLHLTGVELFNKNIKANSFYDRCMKNRILEIDIRI